MAQPSPVPGEPRLSDARRRRRGRRRRAGGVPAAGHERTSAQIDDIRGWLTVVAGRLCLDQLRSARARHERPDESERGSMSLPSAEPRPGRPGHARRRGPRRDVGGAAAAVARASGWPSCCTTSSRCRSRRSPRRSAGPSAPVANSPGGRGRSSPTPHPGSPTSPTPNISSSPSEFITACANGDLEALTAVLDPTVWGVGHHAGRRRAAAAGQPRPRRGGPQPASLPRARRDAGQRAGRASRCCSHSPTGGCSPCSCSRCATT